MAEIKGCCSCIHEYRYTFTEPCVSCGFNFQNYVAKPEPKRKRKTNADRIRAMTDEELAGWVTSGIESVLARCKGYELSTTFEQETLDWLKEPIEEDET